MCNLALETNRIDTWLVIGCYRDQLRSCDIGLLITIGETTLWTCIRILTQVQGSLRLSPLMCIFQTRNGWPIQTTARCFYNIPSVWYNTAQWTSDNHCWLCGGNTGKIWRGLWFGLLITTTKLTDNWSIRVSQGYLPMSFCVSYSRVSKHTVVMLGCTVHVIVTWI